MSEDCNRCLWSIKVNCLQVEEAFEGFERGSLTLFFHNQEDFLQHLTIMTLKENGQKGRKV